MYPSTVYSVQKGSQVYSLIAFPLLTKRENRIAEAHSQDTDGCMCHYRRAQAGVDMVPHRSCYQRAEVAKQSEKTLRSIFGHYVDCKGHFLAL